MKEIVYILYMVASPVAQPEEAAIIWGMGAPEACEAEAARRTRFAAQRGAIAKFWCAEPPSPLAPWKSPIPKPRPEGLTDDQ